MAAIQPSNDPTPNRMVVSVPVPQAVAPPAPKPQAAPTPTPAPAPAPVVNPRGRTAFILPG